MSLWQPVPEELSYGVAIYNFDEDVDYKLKLTVGDTLHLLDEEDNWYYGYILGKNRHSKGIFPKNYIHVKQCLNVDRSGPSPIFTFAEPPIAHEITTILREWGAHWTNLYVNHNKDFEQIKNQIYDLINHRSKIVSGTLPVDELKRVAKQATEEIDLGNKILGLDLVVRDKNGNLIDPNETSTIQLYYEHKNATERMKNHCNKNENAIDNQPKTAVQQYSNIFIVAVKNFTCKMNEDAELLMTLYDGKDFKPITENYVVRWSKDGLMSDLDQMYNLRVMFTDLGKRDLEREKIYLVCYVIRVGSMETKEQDHRRSSFSTSINNGHNSYSSSSFNSNKKSNMRRPFGVAAMEITSFMNGKRDTNLEQEFSVPFVSCDKDNIEQTLKKIMLKDFSASAFRSDNKNQALFVSMKLLRGDLKQVREENPHLVLGNVSIARKMGFPEVILPGDVRNDLYLTVCKGEFSKGSKTSEKNVEVVVKVCNEKGQAIPRVMALGSGISRLDDYRSVIYYHEDKPHWYETFKVAIPIEEFKNSHIKFTFKHRSSNEVKDKNERPFALSHVKLMQSNGTTLKDDRHNLVVYKIDHKKFDEDSLDYLKLPSTLNEIKDPKMQLGGLSVNLKDSFTISSNICSTKLTQNVDLLGLLNWQTNRGNLKGCLRALLNVHGEEVVKFLQDILDSLFNILMEDSIEIIENGESHKSDSYDILVFNCLLHVISLVSNDWKYQHFEPVLDLYIRESFSATLAHKKLISVLKNVISKATFKSHQDSSKDDLIFKTMKSLQYVMRFISRSRILMSKLYPVEEFDDDFDDQLRDLLRDITYMMSSTSDSILREQGACLKYLPSTIPDILQVFDRKELSVILCDMLNNIPSGRLTKQKMMTINEIVHSELFLYADCRRIMLPVFMRQVKVLFEISDEGEFLRRSDGLRSKRQNRSVAKVAQLLGTTQHCLNQHRGYSEEVELCIKILSDILELLFRDDVGNTYDDIMEIIMTVLRTVIQTHINMPRENPHSGNLVAIMIDIFRQMKDRHYSAYIDHFKTRFDILDFLIEILLVFQGLVDQSVYPLDWSDMILLQNNVILKALRFFAQTIRDYFFEKFEHQAWSNFFHCAIAYMTQPTLQMETFSQNKRTKVLKRYNDMRRETGFEIRSMWFNLCQYKVQFVPSLVGSILEMTLIPEAELRKATIPIFFDMMQCEFYSSKFEVESYGDTKRDSSHIKGNFHDFENEMIAKLDVLVEGGKGDSDYKNLFDKIMTDHCQQHTAMHEEGLKFVNTVTRLMERLLEYRCIITDENKENRMSCTVSLLDFYSEINRKEMYIRYLNKLCDLHLECDNYTEAAFTLELHAKLLKWSDDLLPPLLKSSRYNEAQSHRQLKEALYYTIIENYSKGKMWENAISKSEELAYQYRHETFDYDRLSELHSSLSQFYEDIMKKARAEPEYFRVGYYGKGFPLFLQNKVFVYRGKEYERLADFNSRILNEFPKAELLNKLQPPGDEITESDKQFIQINKVDPVMEEESRRFSGRPVADQIVKYYKVNDIKKFTYSRPFVRKNENLSDTGTNNEFAHLWLERTELCTTYPLPGILRWFPVSSVKTHEISPLRNAIETMEKTNKNLRNFVILFNRDRSMQINPLSLTLNGILDAAVMGGIKNYEEAFFTQDYDDQDEDHVLVQKLKDLIADQIPLLELCVQIHKERAPANLQPLQKRLEDCFSKMQENVVEKYGKGSCDVTMRRHFSVAQASGSTELVSHNRNPSMGNSTKSLQLSPTKSLTTSSTLLNQKKSFKTPKNKRRSSKVADNSNNIQSGEFATPTLPSSQPSSGTQWYTTAEEVPLVFELTQELTSKRPLRSEVEKERRLSRPPSGQFSRPNSMLRIGGNNSSGNSSNRDSVGTTDSSVSEEDAVPPPLPVKLRSEVDYCNLPATSESVVNYNNSFLYRNSTRASLKVKLPLPGDNVSDDVPPTPPPKPPKNKKAS